MNRQYFILIIDNGDRLPEFLHDKLTTKGYKVDRVHTVNEAIEFLKHSDDPPTFILADRILDNGPIEIRELEILCKVATNISSEVLVYTIESELSEEDQYEILNQGAYRVLDKEDVHKLVENINILIENFNEILQLTDELKAATADERSKFITALIGTDVTISFLDHNFRQPRNTSFAKLLIGTASETSSDGFCQNRCWLAARKRPASPPKCWGCTVAHVFNSKETVEARFLNRQPNGYCSWVDVQSKPIKSEKTGTIIAVREAVTETTKSTLTSLTSETRLNHIAESLIRIGFGRARIYQFISEGTAQLRAAAACTDVFSNHKRKYFESITHNLLTLESCGYAEQASKNSIGSYIHRWDEKIGVSPLVKDLGLELPYFDVPVFSDNRKLCGWISLDFVGLDENLREQARKDYGKIDSLTWLNEEYGREVRVALETIERNHGSHEKSEIVRRARFGIAGANSMNDAIKAVVDGFRDLLPGCRVSVRILKDNELKEYRPLTQNPWDGGRPNISMDTQHSLAVAVAKRRLPHWINNYPDHLQEAQQRGEPGWYQPEGTQSTAQIPLICEGIVFGTLSISSPKPIQWIEEHYKEPILEFAQIIAWVLTDLVRIHKVERAMNDRAAILAFSMGISADGLWRHWAQQRLSEVSASVASIRIKLNNKTLQPEELEDYLLAISGTIKKIGTAQPTRDAIPISSIEKLFSRLREIYKNKIPSPTFASSEDYKMAAPDFVLRNVLIILLDNALWSIRSSKVGTSVTVNAYKKENYVMIDVSDDGPGIPPEMQESIFRDRVQSNKGHEGQGWGLLYARGAALQHGGGLAFSSKHGETKFSLSLPLTQ
jgi:CheY-like chemotaxis protein